DVDAHLERRRAREQVGRVRAPALLEALLQIFALVPIEQAGVFLGVDARQAPALVQALVVVGPGRRAGCRICPGAAKAIAGRAEHPALERRGHGALAPADGAAQRHAVAREREALELQSERRLGL